MAHVFITYALSEQGRRDSLRQAGNGRKAQETTARTDDKDAGALDAFSVNDNGHVSFDASVVERSMNDPVLVGLTDAEISIESDGKRNRIQWHRVPTREDLFKFAVSLVEYRQFIERTKASVAQAFEEDESARASKVDDAHAIVKGLSFSSDTDTWATALTRSLEDEESLERGRKQTLAEWISRVGSENQRERLIAKVLPWPEAFETIEAHLYEPLSDCVIYERFRAAEVCKCPKRCEVKFSAVNTDELAADEWEVFKSIRDRVPTAGFQFREHTAKCESVEEPERRRGVLVKFALDKVKFKREYALTAVNQ